MKPALTMTIGLIFAFSLILLQTHLGCNPKYCFAQTRSGQVIAYWECK